MNFLMIPILLVNSCIGSINNFINAPITGWFPLACIGVLAVLSIMAMIYMLSPLVGRTELRSWSRAKIYETLFAFLLVLIFGSLTTMLCSINPVPTYSGVGLVPKICNPIYTPAAADVNNIYALAECNLYSYNNNIVAFLNNVIALITYLVSSAPTVTATDNLIPGVSGVFVQLQFPLEASAIKLFFESGAMALGGLVLISQVQLVLLDAAMIILAILLPLGLVARIFGVTRSFGGAMIAFAMGIGFVFPLIISITYGFLGSAIDSFSNPIATASSGIASAILANGATSTADILKGTLIGAFSSLNPFVIFESALEYMGIGLVGTLIIPIITFTIVNTFILDFSQSVGERMDFFSLLTRVV